jgi:hypothetical protein
MNRRSMLAKENIKIHGWIKLTMHKKKVSSNACLAPHTDVIEPCFPQLYPVL